jgi:hypothetical protein
MRVSLLPLMPSSREPTIAIEPMQNTSVAVTNP